MRERRIIVKTVRNDMSMAFQRPHTHSGTRTIEGYTFVLRTLGHTFRDRKTRGLVAVIAPFVEARVVVSFSVCENWASLGTREKKKCVNFLSRNVKITNFFTKSTTFPHL